MHLHFGNDLLQFHKQDYSILFAAQGHISAMPFA